MKRCSFCAEEIQDAAIVCRYCGRELNAPPSGSSQTADVRAAEAAFRKSKTLGGSHPQAASTPLSATMSGPAPRGSRGLAIAGGAFALVVVLAGLSTVTMPRAGNPAISTALLPPPLPVANMTADELFQEYDANEVAADQRLKSKRVRVLGIVDRIGKDDVMGTPFVSFKVSSRSIASVQAMFDKDSDVATLAPGVSMATVCTADGKMLWSVILRHCGPQ